jgi:hypothetical protein
MSFSSFFEHAFHPVVTAFQHAFAPPGSGAYVPPPQDAAKQQIDLMEQQQAAHDAAVAQGKNSIDAAFSQFDDPAYYEKYKQSYLDAYNPQLNDQYGIARDKLIATLAGNDTLESTVGANALSQLDKTRDNAQIGIANSASGAVNGLKSNISNTKTNLYGMNASAADPTAAASQAQAQAGAIVSPQSYPTLTDVFAGALAPFAAAAKSNAGSFNPIFAGNGTRNNSSNPGSNSGSGNYGSAIFSSM